MNRILEIYDNRRANTVMYRCYSNDPFTKLPYYTAEERSLQIWKAVKTAVGTSLKESAAIVQHNGFSDSLELKVKFNSTTELVFSPPEEFDLDEAQTLYMEIMDAIRETYLNGVQNILLFEREPLF